LNYQEKQRLIQQALKDMSDGKRNLLSNPFAGLMPPRLDPSEVARKMFPIEPLPQGAVPVYFLPQCIRCDGHYEDLKNHSIEECNLCIVVDVMES